MKITYQSGVIPTPEQVIELYESAKLPRPTKDSERIKKMYENSDLIVTAWDGEKLVGASRSITDWVWSCYLADLAVNSNYQYLGIGKKLIDHTREQLGKQTMLILLSVPEAMEYYPKVGFTKQESCFFINRQE
ncbi:MAG: GNAT family N-acetyltransferase [Chitinophagaceae bacterium]